MFSWDVFGGLILESGVSWGVMTVAVDGLGDERDIRSDDREEASSDRDLNAIVAATEAHLAFAHFQPRVMGARDETECRANDNGLCFWCREDEQASGRLLL